MTEANEHITSTPENPEQQARPLFITTKRGREEIGYEVPPLAVEEGPLDEETQQVITAMGDSFTETLNRLEWRNGTDNFYHALAGLDKQPVLVNDAAETIAHVTNAQSILLALPMQGASGPNQMRFLVAKGAGEALHGKLIEAVPELVDDGPDGLREAPIVRGVLSTVDFADGNRAQVAALYPYDLDTREPHEAEEMLNTLKAHHILPVACSGQLSVL